MDEEKKADSIGSEDNNLQTFDGRHFHNPGIYFLPNDKRQTDRLETQHYVLKHFFGGNFGAPVEPALDAGEKYVLDIGCGPGHWTIDMANQYTNNFFRAIDICPTDLLASRKNIVFTVHNAKEPLPFPDSTFTLTYQRLASASFTAAQWRHVLLPELLRVTKEEGWLEFLEMDIRFYTETGENMKRLSDALVAFFKSKGCEPFVGPLIKDWLKETGQVENIVHEQRNVVLGKHSGDKNEMALQELKELWMGFGPHVRHIMNLSPEEYSQLVENAVNEAEGEHQVVWKLHRVFGQKK